MRRVVNPSVPRSAADVSGVDDRLVWVDLEMTGLLVETDVIVEIACIVTDASLTALDDGIQLVVHADAETLARMDDFVREMHTKSGLIAEIENSPVSVADAEQATLDVREEARDETVERAALRQQHRHRPHASSPAT